MEQPAEYTKAEKHTVLAAACTAIFINPLVGSMLNLALTAIGDDLDCSTHQLGWLTSVYFMASVMAMMPAAKLSDNYGKKRISLKRRMFKAALDDEYRKQLISLL